MNPNPTIAIAACGIEKVYGTKAQPYRALKGVDLEVQKGDIHLLMGPAGAGKTTLLLIIAGLLTPTSGQVYLLGKNITAMSREELTEFRLYHVGIVFQENHLLRSLTAIENVELLLQLRGFPEQAAYQQARQLLKAVGLEGKMHLRPRLLSVGQQQRVGVARALAGSPSLIIADEPTASLDSENGRTVTELLRKLAKEEGCTVLMATHDPRIIPLADRVTYLEDGMIIEPNYPQLRG